MQQCLTEKEQWEELYWYRSVACWVQTKQAMLCSLLRCVEYNGKILIRMFQELTTKLAVHHTERERKCRTRRMRVPLGIVWRLRFHTDVWVLCGYCGPIKARLFCFRLRHFKVTRRMLRVTLTSTWTTLLLWSINAGFVCHVLSKLS